ncbi:MAG: hypothetical protein ACJ731_06875 [Vicinamibacterales bacterium]
MNVESSPKFHITAVGCAVAAAVLLSVTAAGQAKDYALESANGLHLHNVAAQPAVLQGKKGVRVTVDEAARKQAGQAEIDQLARIDGLEFANGTIEAEIAGSPIEGASAGARGFVGIAFRLQDDMKTYDAFYLRPTNGRADDQERRNHALQYISHPQWTWQRLRQENPSKYESYADLVPGEWTKIKIEVHGDRARLYVHENAQAALVVNDVKSGAEKRGGIALWIGPETVGHFRNLRVTASPN